MGLFGGSNSSSSNQTDKRLVTGESSAGSSIDAKNGSTVNLTQNITDAGIVSRALDSVDLANATAGDGFTRLVQAGESLIGQTQKNVADAYAVANESKGGSLDNKTLMILGVAAIGAVAAIASKGKQ